MGKTDIVTKNYMRGSDIFADAFNFLIYNGEARIQSQSLQERDVTELAVLFSNDSVKNETEVQQKYRDVLKRAVIMQNKEATYLLLGIENQTDIHYAMPVRNMIYDSLQYGKPVSYTHLDVYKRQPMSCQNRLWLLQPRTRWEVREHPCFPSHSWIVL